MQRIKDCLNNIKLQNTPHVETKSQSNEKFDQSESVLKAQENVDQGKPISSYLTLDEICPDKAIPRGTTHEDNVVCLSSLQRCLHTVFKILISQ
jgi:hypothetical protein